MIDYDSDKIYGLNLDDSGSDDIVDNMLDNDSDDAPINSRKKESTTKTLNKKDKIPKRKNKGKNKSKKTVVTKQPPIVSNQNNGLINDVPNTMINYNKREEKLKLLQGYLNKIKFIITKSKTWSFDTPQAKRKALKKALLKLKKELIRKGLNRPAALSNENINLILDNTENINYNVLYQQMLSANGITLQQQNQQQNNVINNNNNNQEDSFNQYLDNVYNNMEQQRNNLRNRRNNNLFNNNNNQQWFNNFNLDDFDMNYDLNNDNTNSRFDFSALTYGKYRTVMPGGVGNINPFIGQQNQSNSNPLSNQVSFTLKI